MKKRVFWGICLWAACVAYVCGGEPITKGALLKTFYKANTYHDAGNDSMAIVTLEEVAMRVPRLPITYLRMAEIYDDMAAADTTDAAALNGAVLMYRRYLSLELNEQKTAKASARLKELENRLNVAHFEEEDERAGEAAMASGEAIPVVVDDEATAHIAAAATAIKAGKLKGITPDGGEIDQPASPSRIAAIDISPSEADTEPEADVVKNFSTEALASQSCDRVPDLGTLKVSRLKMYGIQEPEYVGPEKPFDRKITQAGLTGHWVSTIANEEGRETWIFDIEPFGDTYSITLHKESGVLQSAADNKKSLYSKVIGLLEENEFLSNTKQTIICDQVEGTVNNNKLIFTLESEKDYKPSTGIYTWGRTLLENLSSVIPFGNIVYKFGDSYLSKRSEKDVEAVYTIESRFSCTFLADGVLECSYIRTEKKTAKGKGTKIVDKNMSNFYLYRTTGDYVCFTPMDLAGADMNYMPLFEKVADDAIETIEMNYPLAFLYLYGIGTEQSDTRAVELMTELAREKNCGRAMAWLATFYFNLAYKDDEEVSTSLRKKYLKTSRFWLSKMQQQDMPAWYALRADMDESSNEPDSVLHYYKLGALKGDPYAAYKVAMCALRGRYMGDKRNLPMAQRYLDVACEAHYPEAYLQRALMCRDGIGCPRDTAAYVSNLFKAVDMNSSAALGELSEAYIRGLGVERDATAANLMREYKHNADRTVWMDILALYGYDVEKYR